MKFLKRLSCNSDSDADMVEDPQAAIDEMLRDPSLWDSSMDLLEPSQAPEPSQTPPTVAGEKQSTSATFLLTATSRPSQPREVIITTQHGSHVATLSLRDPVDSFAWVRHTDLGSGQQTPSLLVRTSRGVVNQYCRSGNTFIFANRWTLPGQRVKNSIAACGICCPPDNIRDDRPVFAAPLNTGKVAFFQTLSLTAVKQIQVADRVVAMVSSHDGKQLALGCASSKAVIVDWHTLYASFAELAAGCVPAGPVSALQWAPDNETLLIICERRLFVCDTVVGQTTWHDLGQHTICDAAVSPEDGRLAVLADDRFLFVSPSISHPLAFAGAVDFNCCSVSWLKNNALLVTDSSCNFTVLSC